MAKLLSGTRIYGTATVDTQVLINGGLATSSTATGSLQVFGGAGISGSLFVGGTITATNFVGNISGSAGATTGALTAGTGLTSSGGTFNGSTNITFSLNTATLMANAVSASTATNAGTAYATIAAHTAGTGLSGSTFNGSTAQTWTLNTATLMASSVAIAGGTTGQLVYQSAANTTAFVGPGTAGQLLVSAGASAPVYTNTASIFVNSSRYADNLTGGAGGSIVYQSAANATTSLAIGTNGYVLTSNGSVPSWVAPSSLAAASATQVTTQAQSASATYYPTFVSANNASATAMSEYTTSSFYINPATGAIVCGGSVLATGGLYSGATSGATRALLSSNGDLNSYYAAESTARIQLGRDVGVSGGAGLALGGSSYALISANDTSGAILYFKLSASAGTASTSPNMTLNSTGLGIGTTGVGAPLSFVDATGLKIQLNANAANYYAIEKQAAVNGGDSMFKYNAGQTSAGEHGFYSGNALKLLIDASGNAIHSQGSNIVIRGTTGASAEGAQIVLGYGNNTSSAIFGQANYTWNLDVAAGLANNDFRIFRQNSAGVALVAAQFTEATGSVQLVSVGVGTAGSGTSGEIRATNEITAYYSDRRLKTNVSTISNAVEKVQTLNGITYSPNDLAASFGYDKTVKLVGLFADEVEAVLPEATRPAPFDQDENGGSKSGENYRTIQYEKLVPLLVEAIKEQQQTINDQNSRIEKLEQLVKNLANKYSE